MQASPPAPGREAAPPGSGGPELTQLPVAAAAAALGTDLSVGLASAEASGRLVRLGRNEVPEKKRHALLAFLSKFWGPSAWMIELVVLVSIPLRRSGDLVLGIGLLVANAALAFLQEQRASAAVAALRSRLRVMARVLRDGSWRLLPAAEVVPGDVLRLRAGDFVPADAKVISGAASVDQSALTGESVESGKGPEGLLYSGSLIRHGEVSALALFTGTRTYYGRTTQLVQSARPRLHVEEVVGRLVRWLLLITGALTASALAVALLRGFSLLEILPLLLLLLLGALPVALPVMFTVSMALGALELSRHNVLVTRLSAVEDAATMDILCADKTGTITENRLELADVTAEPPHSRSDVLRAGAMASEGADQDPIDLALLAAARKEGLGGEPSARREFHPFSAETRRTEALFGEGDGRIRVVKGALPTVAQMSALGAADKARLEAAAGAAAARGWRALAVARSLGDGPLELLGLAFLQDPPRPDSRALISELRELGVGVKMLTGDSLPVAQEVARAVGLDGVSTMASFKTELGHGQDRAAQLVERSGGFAEVFPEDKYTVVRALQAAGHVVGMTGDGVNDAPALRQAEVGIAVSTATDVAKASASAVLTAEGITSIVQLVKSGRAVYQRVLTWIVNKVSRTIHEAGYVTLAFLATGRFVISAFGMILLLFMTDFVRIAIATDRVEGSSRPETWKIGAWVKLSVTLGLLMLAENLALLAFGPPLLGLGADPARAQTFSFQSLLYFGLFSMMSVRERGHFWRSRPSPVLLGAVLADAIVGALLPFLRLPGLHPLPLLHTAAIVGVAALASLGLNDLVKTVLVRRAGLARAPPAASRPIASPVTPGR